MIIRVHLEATTVCRGIAVSFEPCILLVSIQKNAFMLAKIFPGRLSSEPPPAAETHPH